MSIPFDDQPLNLSPSPFLAHLLVNHSLKKVFLIMDSPPPFIEFVEKLYRALEYDSELVPLAIEPSVGQFTIREWNLFCDDTQGLYGKEIHYDTITKDLSAFREEFFSYVRAHRAFQEKKRSLWSLMMTPKPSDRWIDSKTERKKLDEWLKTRAPSHIPSPSPFPERPEMPETPLSTQPWYGTVEMYDDASPYYFIHRDAEEAKTVVPETVRTIVVYDDAQTTTLVIQGADCEWVPKWMSLVGGITILKDYEGLYANAVEKVVTYFHQRPFVDGADAQEHMNSFDLLHHLSKKRSVLEYQIQSYLTRNYTMSKDGKKLMKASVLQECIETALSDSTIGNQPIIESAIADTLSFRKLISAVLLEMGLQKKRLSDGIYYYGIEPKIPRELAMSTALETLTREREQHKEILMKHWATLPKKSE
jgi:hypothetical protein